jgi:hypothetical protein
MESVDALMIDGGPSDPEGASLILAVSPAGPYSYNVSSYKLTLTITDPKGLSSRGTAIVTVIKAPTELLSPTPAPSIESVSHKVCENFAVHARTTVTFDGVLTTIQGGDVGFSPSTSITSMTIGDMLSTDGAITTGAGGATCEYLPATLGAITVGAGGA